MRLFCRWICHNHVKYRRRESELNRTKTQVRRAIVKERELFTQKWLYPITHRVNREYNQILRRRNS